MYKMCSQILRNAPFDKQHSASVPREEDSDDDLAVAPDIGKKKSYAETARMFKLRRNLDQLDCFHQQKEHDVLKARFQPSNQ